MTTELLVAIGIGLGLTGGTTFLVFILRDQRNRIKTLEQMLQEFVPDSELKQFFNGQDKKMSDFVPAKEYDDHKTFCANEFAHGRAHMESMDKKLDEHSKQLKEIGESVAVLADRARRFREDDLG